MKSGQVINSYQYILNFAQPCKYYDLNAYPIKAGAYFFNARRCGVRQRPNTKSVCRKPHAATACVNLGHTSAARRRDYWLNRSALAIWRIHPPHAATACRKLLRRRKSWKFSTFAACGVRQGTKLGWFSSILLIFCCFSVFLIRFIYLFHIFNWFPRILE